MACRNRDGYRRSTIYSAHFDLENSMGVDRAFAKKRCYTWVAPNWRTSTLRVLTDYADPDTGFAIWTAISRIRLWAETPEDRDALYSSGGGGRSGRSLRNYVESTDADLKKALVAFDRLCDRRSAPSASEIVTACKRMALWAETSGYVETAMQFAEAAAAIDPENPRLANLAGRVARRAGERGRAEVWYSRAIGLARSSQNLREYAGGYLGLSAVLRDGGQHRRAIKLIFRAGNAAKRAGLRGTSAGAYHAALGVSALVGDYRRAIHFAQRVIHIYPVHHKRLPAFAGDFSYLLVSLGLHDSARSILPDLIPKLDRPVERVIAWGTLARAAGGCGDAETYGKALEEIRKGASQYRSVGDGALFCAADGARSLRRWHDAEELAEAAIAHAREMDSPVVLGLSRDLLEQIRQRREARWRETSGPETDLLRTLAKEMKLRLARWRGPTWRPKKGRPPEDDDMSDQ